MDTADLANLSDKLMLTTVVLYIVAMVSYAADLGFGRRRAAAEAQRTAARAEKKADAKVLVGAGAPADADAGAATADDAEPPAPRRGTDWARLAVALTLLGWVAHFGVIITRGLAVSRWPWGNMYEFLTAIAFAAMTGFLLVLWRFKARFLGAFVTLAAVIALGVANIWLYDSAGPVSPALNSYWIAIHVTAAIIATGAFTVAGCSTILYVLRERRDAAKAVDAPGGFWSHVPSTEDLDRLALRVTTFAFPVWTAAIIMGAIWADDAWGSYWSWDPKEIWSFVTWIIYAAYLHARATAGWKGRKAAILSLIAFAALLFNFFGVNYMFSGMHSYA
ncbi:c-type cytochrome biogenesis protein CcsB [Actinomadura atramentaria]|uniref:c-type cytochrome biogenesis protein CcsB n=1 Tax=Actinomadura atramentaria TaxID=1990 RepID=UPI00036619DB|nr:c-type cytochrome biogenesis protein CcsB [Actinomadura atramentaria]